MAKGSKIEWTDDTWNPTRGCSRVSEGCRNCYAEGVAQRFSGPGQPYEGLVRIDAAGSRKAEWNGQIQFVEKHLLGPLSWGPVKIKCVYCDMQGHPCDGSHSCTGSTSRPRRIFVNSMSDLFHEGVTDEQLDRIFAVMSLSPQHVFQVLTKRPERMLAYSSRPDHLFRIKLAAEAIQRDRKMVIDRSSHRSPAFLAHVWLGVSVEDQKTADERIPLLLQAPAARRFVSYEPALGPIDFNLIPRPFEFHSSPYGWMNWLARKLPWIIVGGESGPGARPFNVEWAGQTVREFKNSGVAVFVKQVGARPRDVLAKMHMWPDWRDKCHQIEGTGESAIIETRLVDRKGGDMSEWPEDLRVRQMPADVLAACRVQQGVAK